MRGRLLGLLAGALLAAAWPVAATPSSCTGGETVDGAVRLPGNLYVVPGLNGGWELWRETNSVDGLQTTMRVCGVNVEYLADGKIADLAAGCVPATNVCVR